MRGPTHNGVGIQHRKTGNKIRGSTYSSLTRLKAVFTETCDFKISKEYGKHLYWWEVGTARHNFEREPQRSMLLYFVPTDQVVPHKKKFLARRSFIKFPVSNVKLSKAVVATFDFRSVFNSHVC